jgi:hypothetical protein
VILLISPLSQIVMLLTPSVICMCVLLILIPSIRSFITKVMSE